MLELEWEADRDSDRLMLWRDEEMRRREVSPNWPYFRSLPLTFEAHSESNTRLRRMEGACRLMSPVFIASIDSVSNVAAIWTTFAISVFLLVPRHILMGKVCAPCF